MSTALVPTVEQAGNPPPALTTVDYRPKPKDWQFLQAVQEAIDKHGKADCPTIGGILGVTKQAVWKRLQDAAFAAWVNQELRRAVDELWPRVMYKTATLAVKGSPEHIKILAGVRGELRGRDGDEGAGGPAFNVTVLIPRPPQQ